MRETLRYLLQQNDFDESTYELKSLMFLSKLDDKKCIHLESYLFSKSSKYRR